MFSYRNIVSLRFMKLKKVIALFCVLVLCTQVLPVQQMGALLFGNQLNEELNHLCDAGKDDVSKKEIKTDYFLADLQLYNSFIAAAILEYRHYQSTLPHNYSGEIQTPPPNIFPLSLTV